tara:strand:+ start:4342 stop:4623 length:282 start_codon:yes stop_codon:yes gene_type:complete
MKSIKFLMVLLFTSAIFVSCGGGVEADIERYCELECASKADDFDKGSEEGKAALKEWEEIAAKYEGDDSEASDEDKKAWEDKKACECEKKDDK